LNERVKPKLKPRWSKGELVFIQTTLILKAGDTGSVFTVSWPSQRLMKMYSMPIKLEPRNVVFYQLS
jgi:hypothetical protein